MNKKGEMEVGEGVSKEKENKVTREGHREDIDDKTLTRQPPPPTHPGQNTKRPEIFLPSEEESVVPVA